MKLAAAMPRGADARHGLQLAAAVALSYLVSAGFGLPEGFWAVMSALIVTRPDTGATLGAGWDRVRGTVLGTACGLLGVWLRDAGLGAPAATLAIVALLAFASAGAPLLRSAPITALIVLSSSGIAQHSALQVAGLRVAEIGIGVVVGLAISVALPGARAARRFDAACADVLQQIAAQLRQALGERPRSAAEKDAASASMRAALRQLVQLGDSAGREARFRFAGWRGHTAAAAVEQRPSPARVARLVMRSSQDAALLARLFESQAATPDEQLWSELREAANAALTSVAQALADKSRADLAALRRIDAGLAERRADTSRPADDTALLLAAPLRWLLDDLRALSRIAAAG